MVQQDDQTREVKRFFADSADYWRDLYLTDEPFNAYAYPYHRRQANVLALLQKFVSLPAAVLDVGCGAGVQALAMAKAGYTVQGVDLATEMIETARKLIADEPELANNLQFDVANVGQLPFPDESFAAVTLLGVLEYMDEPRTAVSQIARVLKPGGVVILSVPNRASPFRWLGVMGSRLLMRLRNIRWLRRLKYRLLRQENFADAFAQPGQYRHHAYTAVQLRRILAAANLEPIADTYQVFGSRISDLWLPIPFALVRRLEKLNRWRLTRWLGSDYIIAARRNP